MKYLKRINFACDEEVQVPMVKWFQEQPEVLKQQLIKTVMLAALYQTRGLWENEVQKQ